MFVVFHLHFAVYTLHKKISFLEVIWARGVRIAAINFTECGATLHTPVIEYYAAGIKNVGVERQGISSLQGFSKDLSWLVNKLVEVSLYCLRQCNEQSTDPLIFIYHRHQLHI